MSALSKSRSVTVRKEDGKRIEEETRKMEAKLEMLRKTMDAAAAEAPAKGSDGRWKGGSASKPIRGYVKGVLDTKPSTKARTQQPTSSTGGGTASAPGSAGRGGRGRPGSPGPKDQTMMAADGTVGELLVGRSATASPVQRRAEASPQAATSSSATAVVRGGAAGNLQSALNQQNEEAQEVESFLAGLKLDRYVSIFFENGFDSMDVVQEMEESHMREIGMAVGHIVKLNKKLAELKPAPKQVGPDPTPAAATASPQQQRGGGARDTQRKVSFGVVEDAREAGRAAATSSDGGGGNFDEAESAASFQQALRAWREGRDCPGSASSSSKPAPVSSAAPKATGSFWSTVGGDEVDLQRCSTPVRAPTEGVDSETQRDPAPSEDKLCCYNCYKQFYKQFAVERCSPLSEGTTPRAASLGASLGGGGAAKRLLCSEACADRWVAAMEEKAAAQRRRQDQLENLREAQRAFELGQGVGTDGDLVVEAA